MSLSSKFDKTVFMTQFRIQLNLLLIVEFFRMCGISRYDLCSASLSDVHGVW